MWTVCRRHLCSRILGAAPDGCIGRTGTANQPASTEPHRDADGGSTDCHLGIDHAVDAVDSVPAVEVCFTRSVRARTPLRAILDSALRHLGSGWSHWSVSGHAVHAVAPHQFRCGGAAHHRAATIGTGGRDAAHSCS